MAAFYCLSGILGAFSRARGHEGRSWFSETNRIFSFFASIVLFFAAGEVYGYQWSIGALVTIGVLFGVYSVAITTRGFRNVPGEDPRARRYPSARDGGRSTLRSASWPSGSSEVIPFLTGYLERYRLRRVLPAQYQVVDCLGDSGLTTSYAILRGSEKAVLKVLRTDVTDGLDAETVVAAVEASANAEDEQPSSSRAAPLEWGEAGGYAFYAMPFDDTAEAAEHAASATEQLMVAASEVSASIAKGATSAAMRSGQDAGAAIAIGCLLLVLTVSLVPILILSAPVWAVSGLASLVGWLASLPWYQTLPVVIGGPLAAFSLVGFVRLIADALTRQHGWWSHQLALVPFIALPIGLLLYELFSPWCTIVGASTLPRCDITTVQGVAEFGFAALLGVIAIGVLDVWQNGRFRSNGASAWRSIREFSDVRIPFSEDDWHTRSAMSILDFWASAHRRGRLGLLGFDAVEVQLAAPFLTSQAFSDAWASRRSEYSPGLQEQIDEVVRRLRSEDDDPASGG